MKKPIRLYRYMDQRGAIGTIRDQGFRVGRILRLNDPFEYSVGFKNLPEGKVTGALLTRDYVRKCLDEQYGVLCYSKPAHDPVLWSHYAGHHRGVAFEVECSPEEFKNELIKIKYSKKRVCIPFGYHIDPNANHQKLRKIFKPLIRRKSWNWRYEGEYRGVVDLKTCRNQDGEFVWTPPKGFIKRVIIGCRSRISVKRIRRLLDLNGFESVEIAKAQESYSSYKIEF